MQPVLSACMHELESRGLLPEDALSVSVVGSVARGWANATSDFDFNIVTSTPWSGPSVRTVAVPLDPGTVSSTALQVDDRRWEVKYWTDAQVDQMIAKVGWPEFEGGTTTAKALVLVEELFVERLVSCVPLLGADWITRRRDQIAGTAFNAFITTRSLGDADDSVEDALGQLDAGDLESAVLSARKALGHTVDALLESHGSYGSRTPKWRARRLRETPLEALSFDDYWALETMRDFDPAEPQHWVYRVVSLCKDLSITVEI